MQFLTHKKLLSACALLVMLSGLIMLPTGGAVSTASGAATCPVTVRIKGSTTVGPMTDAAKTAFESLWPGTTQANHPGDPAWEGSGAGINAIRSGDVNVGQSSRSLTAAEYTGLYVYKVAKDQMVIATFGNDTSHGGNSSMDFITGVTTAQVKN